MRPPLPLATIATGDPSDSATGSRRLRYREISARGRHRRGSGRLALPFTELLDLAHRETFAHDALGDGLPVGLIEREERTGMAASIRRTGRAP